jgi:monofunctional biosynthetic peptidoglycan transglycosylase
MTSARSAEGASPAGRRRQRPGTTGSAASACWRFLLLVAVCTLALQLFFLARIALMLVVDPQSTTFQRSEILRLAVDKHQVAWAQQWVDQDRIAAHLKRAVIASEDAGFADHSGVEWDALEAAWDKNQRAEAAAERRNAQLAAQSAAQSARRAPPPDSAAAKPRPAVVPKVVGGSTISQQLAKNLFLSAERTVLRKAQEFVLTFMLEGLLSKRRILEIYLNNVEWGEGLFGAQAAARHYFRLDAAQLGPSQAARLAVMLPAPKRFEKNPGSGYMASRAATIAARMGGVALP